MKLKLSGLFFVGIAWLSIPACTPGGDKTEAVVSDSYEDLISLFREWREFQKPEVIDGVPDYSATAMAKQRRELPSYVDRLAAIHPATWPVSQQVDYQLVRAEMNGLDFDHRILRPWSRNPCFYVVVSDSEPDVPAREGPEMYGSILVPEFPLPSEDVAGFREKLKKIPAILEQAKGNLVEDAKDLWWLGIRVKKNESEILDNLALRLAEHHPDLVADAERAKVAVDGFGAWLEEKQAAMTASSGIGVDNFNWYMKNVHLVPYTWQDQLVLIERELERAMAFLKLEENRNRKLPQLVLATSEEEYERRFFETADEIMGFLRQEEFFTVPDTLHVSLDPGSFVPPTRIRDFFLQVEYRDSLPLRCHGTHTFDRLREAGNRHPIRGLPLLYNIWDGRAEGLATGFEEMMVQAGLFEKQPRARELVYILLANRAARAIGDLKLHSNEFNLEEAVDFSVKRTPYGWLSREGNTVWTDMRIYLHQPGYGASYIIGKVELDKLISVRSWQLDDEFSLRRFMDDFFATGMIPMSLIRWEMTGLEDEVKKLW